MNDAEAQRDEEALEARSIAPSDQGGSGSGSAEVEKYNTLGIAQATQNMGLQAIASFTKAIELDPENAGYYYNLTGHVPDPTFLSQGNNRTPYPDDWPYMGSVVSSRRPPHPDGRSVGGVSRARGLLSHGMWSGAAPTRGRGANRTIVQSIGGG